jgi:hypothetical protein
MPVQREVTDYLTIRNGSIHVGQEQQLSIPLGMRLRLRMRTMMIQN